MSGIVGPGSVSFNSLENEAARDAAELLAINARNAKRGALAPMMIKKQAAEAKRQAAIEQLAQAEHEADEDARKLEASAAFLSLDDVAQDKKEVLT